MKNIVTLCLLFLAVGQLPAQCLWLQNCPANQPVCDYTSNDANYWDETYWNDPVHNTHDLTDAPASVSVLVRDTCPGANTTLRYLLFLDLDLNGVMETVVKSWEPPAPGTVNFNNWNNPNFEGGEVRNFDQRPVPADQKYQFAIQTTVTGDSTLGQLRWNTPAQPSAFVNPHLPYGTHKIKWLADDNLGNDGVCEYTLAPKDCKNPIVVCINGLSANVMPTGQITLWATDFLQYAEDNATPGPQIQIGIRKSGTGSGFPQNPDGSPVNSLTFDCSELGTQPVEIWARDIAGNADYCETYVSVQDNMNNCGGGGGTGNPPVVVCITGISANIMPTGQITLWASDFLQYASDDDTPSNLLEIGIRKGGTGSGFPEDASGNPVQSVTFDCDELGIRTIELWARDTAGNADFCETYVLVEDNMDNCSGGGGGGNAPIIVCLNGLSANIMPTMQVTLWASDFLQYAEDDVTPSSEIIIGIRKAGTGNGFPEDANGLPVTSVTFTCNELGTNLIELWAKDSDGNADFCQTTAIIQDNAGNCDGVPGAELTICMKSWCGNQIITGGTINIDGSVPFAPPFSYFMLDDSVDVNGCYVIDSLNSIPIASTYVIAPERDDNPLNGVTVFDLIKLKRFLLGLETDWSPYAQIAADANKSGSVTGYDLVELRKLLVGIYSELPNNTSWRFVEAVFEFPNPQNPFQTVYPETISIADALATQYNVGFKGIKIGDFDCDATPGLQGQSQSRNLPQSALSLPDVELQPGQTFELPIQMAEPGSWEGLQFRLTFDPEKMEILSAKLSDQPGFAADADYKIGSGTINLAWASDRASLLLPGQDLLTLRVRALAPLRVSEAISAALDFENIGSLDSEARSLILQFRKGSAANASAIFAPQPNPTAAGANIPLHLVQTERVQVELTDLAGRVLWQETQTLSAGSHLLAIPPQAMPQAGAYLWRVRAGEVAASGKLMRQ